MGELGRNGDHVYENETFCVKAYDWSEWEDDIDPNEWHFWHKPSGLRIYWYKYPLRACECNVLGLSHEFLLEVLKDCYNSQQRDNGEKVKVYYDCFKWWDKELWNK